MASSVRVVRSDYLELIDAIKYIVEIKQLKQAHVMSRVLCTITHLQWTEFITIAYVEAFI